MIVSKSNEIGANDTVGAIDGNNESMDIAPLDKFKRRSKFF